MTSEPKFDPPFGIGSLIGGIRTMVQEIGESVFQQREPLDEDWTNPTYVLTAVQAQIEDLTPQQKCRVLADALTVAIAELRD